MKSIQGYYIRPPCKQSAQLDTSIYTQLEHTQRDWYGDQIVTCDVSVSLHSKTHPLFIQAHSVMHTSIRACFLSLSTFSYLSPFFFTCILHDCEY